MRSWDGKETLNIYITPGKIFSYVNSIQFNLNSKFSLILKQIMIDMDHLTKLEEMLDQANNDIKNGL